VHVLIDRGCAAVDLLSRKAVQSLCGHFTGSNLNGRKVVKLTSPAFEHLAEIPQRFTCEGENVSPPLEWSDVPEGTQSLALTLEDPDAPTGRFLHWAVWGISPTVTSVAEGEVPPEARQGLNGFGLPGYGGPCPEPGSGTHSFIFTLLALSVEPGVPEGAALGQLRKEIDGQVIDRAVLAGTFGR
jgi:Raf kinase inhibitor-like YbhB/YbcL family protein